MKYRFFILGLAVALFAACAVNEEDKVNPAVNDGEEFYATIEGATTKVYVDEDLKVLWHADDRVSIFNKYTYNQQYRFTGNTGANSGSFQKVPNEDFVTGNALDYVYAVYPFQEATEISNQGILTVELPAVQTYSENSFGVGANTMVSCSEGNELMFKNLCGYLMLKLYGDDVTVTSISLRGNNNEPLAGKANIAASIDGNPSLSFDTSATKEITLTFDTPVTLGTTAETATTFWMVVPPTTFDKGFQITVSGEGNEFMKSTEKSLTIERNKLSRMSPVLYKTSPVSKVESSCSFSEITISKCSVNVHLEFNEDVSSGIVGVIYSENSDPLSSNNKSENRQFWGMKKRDFSFSLSGLNMNTEYFCVPFVLIQGEYIYGDIFSFHTSNITYPTQGDYIDLGVGVLWGSSNLGASKPTDAGSRFAWGELVSKESFTLDNYSLYLGDNYLNIGNSIVNTEYDVCLATLGKGYRLPHASEISSLFTELSYAWAEYDGVKGVIVQGINGNSIFIPYSNTNTYSGYHTIEGSSYSTHFYGEFAGLMSGELSTKQGTTGYVICLLICPEVDSGPVAYKYNQVWYEGHMSRETGQSVRAVFDNK